jgi:hypothetical protein
MTSWLSEQLLASDVRECIECSRSKPLEECPIHKKATGRRRRRCRECQRAYWRRWRAANAESHNATVKRWREANPEKRRASARRRYYGLSPAETSAMLAAQDSQCAICRRSIHDGKDGFCVDHDHQTGRVRGLLCRKCNVLLGQAEDRSDVLRAAIDYLDASGGNSS